MASPETRRKYTTTIGIECHVQLKIKTKLFSAVGNDARQADPNTLISHIDLGMPGALPVLNEKAVEYAVRAGFALGTEPQKYSYFERKHYFYPDLPKGYQITQLSHPIVKGGHVTIEAEGKSKTVHVNRVQMEEDAGKSTHPVGKDYSLVDLNRAGTPLLEIVSEPDMHNAAEAKAYAKELYLLMRYADVSDADMYYGNMRFDVNVSVSKTDTLGTRTETKNLNSFRSVEKAVEYEINRQLELLEKGQAIIQETRGWDDAKQKTFSQRGKEEAHDYRYMPEPDIPPLELSQKFIDDIRIGMPELPDSIRTKLKGVDVDKEVIEEVLNWPSIVPTILELLEKDGPKSARQAVFWILHSQLSEVEVDGGKVPEVSLDWKKIKQLTDLLEAKKLSSTSARIIFQEIISTNEWPEEIALRLNLIQVSDEGKIAEIVETVLKENAKAAEDVKNGEAKAIGFLVGQVMKASKGKANPELAQKLIKKQLGL